MAVDTQRTSQQVSVIGTEKSTISGFDLRSWQGLTQVLQVARASGMSSGAYAQFRNLILQYAQHGGDLELKKQVEAAIAAIPQKSETHIDTQETVESSERAQNKDIPAAKTPTRPSRSSLGGRRPVPSFMPVHVGESHTHADEVLPVTAPLPHEAVSAPAPIPTVVVEESVIGAVPVAPQSVTSQAVVPEAVPPTPQETPSKTEPKPAAEVLSQVKPMEEYRARIAEIKREVNARVGNPVALIDAQNQTGRTYMTALLAAMKATSPGSAVRIEDAMASLEAAYAAVLSHQGAEVHDVIQTPSTGEIASGPQIVDTPVVVSLESHSDSVKAPLVSAIPTHVPFESADAAPQELPKAARVLPKIPSLLDLESEDTVPNTHSEYDTPIPQSRSQAEEKKKSVVTTSTRSITPAAPSYDTAHQDMHVAEVPPYVAVMQTELASPEITESLNQLLHEWSIFKSSGVFGMGPGGIDHPLYTVLARLTMGEVISGRFEHAEPEIIYTIKEYVDAWRHEQGVAYNPTETFEHYLRRVVQHILKRQKEETTV